MTDQNLEAVKNLAEAYISATYEGDAETFKRIFADVAVMNGYLNGELMKGGPEPFIQQMEYTITEIWRRPLRSLHRAYRCQRRRRQLHH